MIYILFNTKDKTYHILYSNLNTRCVISAHDIIMIISIMPPHTRSYTFVSMLWKCIGFQYTPNSQFQWTMTWIEPLTSSFEKYDVKIIPIAYTKLKQVHKWYIKFQVYTTPINISRKLQYYWFVGNHRITLLPWNWP